MAGGHASELQEPPWWPVPLRFCPLQRVGGVRKLTFPENRQPRLTLDAANSKRPNNLQVTLDKTWKSFIICVLLGETSRSPPPGLVMLVPAAVPQFPVGHPCPAPAPGIGLLFARLTRHSPLVTRHCSSIPAALLQIHSLPDCAETRHTRHTHSLFILNPFIRLRTLSVTPGGTSTRWVIPSEARNRGLVDPHPAQCGQKGFGSTPSPLPIFCKDVIPWDLASGVRKEYHSKGVRATALEARQVPGPLCEHTGSFRVRFRA